MSEHKKCPVCRGEPFIKSSHDEDMCYWERVECRKCGLSTRGKWASDRSNACAIFREEVWAEWDDRAEPEREVEPVAWIPVSERLPEKGMFVLVYTPPCYGQEEGSTGLDLIDPSSDGDVWLIHSESYRSEEHTSELQSRENLVCRILLEKTK